MATDHQSIHEIFLGTAAATGHDFFAALVRHLAGALGTKCAWVTEWQDEGRRLRALAFWCDGGYVPDFEYAVAGTPCEQVLAGRELMLVEEGVVDLYPRDPDLPPLGAVSYLGQPLLDTDGRLFGNLAVIDDKPLRRSAEVTAIFQIFGARAAAELARLRRERDVREREQKLVRLVDSAMDAIVELDADLRIVRVNPAAERALRADATAMTGRPLDAWFAPGSSARLGRVAAELLRRPAAERAVWIPDGLEARRTDGTTFAAEASLSSFELDGRSCFTIILRNVEERLAAERRIRSLTDETATLRAELDALRGAGDIVGESEALRRMAADVELVAATDTTVLITGETGTGKELVARAIHRRSARCDGPLVTVNCAAVAAGLQEAEFFGHERGAFTGAVQRRDGRFHHAHRGTLFLDEVGEMPLELQAKLLRVLQEGEVERVGGGRPEQVDVRVLAATNRDLAQMVRDGRFREDLWYRLNAFPVRVPPLRERDGDVLLIAEACLERLARRRGCPVPALTAAQRDRLRRYDWPGNVRELQNVIERAFITSLDGRTPNLDRALPDVRAATDQAAAPPPTVPARVLTVAEMVDFERDNLRRALEQSRGKVSGSGGAAALLGIHPNTLASRLRALGLRGRSDS